MTRNSRSLLCMYPDTTLYLVLFKDREGIFFKFASWLHAQSTSWCTFLFFAHLCLQEYQGTVACTTIYVYLCLVAPFWPWINWRFQHTACTEGLWTHQKRKDRELGLFHCFQKTSSANSSRAYDGSIAWLKAMWWHISLSTHGCARSCAKRGLTRKRKTSVKDDFLLQEQSIWYIITLDKNQ